MSKPLSKVQQLVLRRSIQARLPLRLQSRFNSTQQTNSGAAPKETSPHVGFYQVFARPIAKVLLMATFTYQLTYWLWVKLEKDEIKRERSAEITQLELKLQDLVEKKKAS